MWDGALNTSEKQASTVVELTDDDDSTIQRVLVLCKPDAETGGWTDIPNDQTPVGVWHIQGIQLHTLRPGMLISVSVIDGFLKLLDENIPAGSLTYIFNTSHFTARSNFGIEAIRRRTSTLSLFSYNFLVLPVALEGHYFLIVLDIRQHTLFLYDSLEYQQNDVCQLALQWLKKGS